MIPTKKEALLSTISLSFFFSFLLSVVFEGKTLYALAILKHIEPKLMMNCAIVSHVLGLLIAPFFVRYSIKKIMFISVFLSAFFSTLFFFSNMILWLIACVVAGFFSGLTVALWGAYLQTIASSIGYLQSVAITLALSNILMVIIDSITLFINPFIGLIVAIGFSLISLLIPTIPIELKPSVTTMTKQQNDTVFYLYFFIVILAINSGLMYRVFNPHFKTIVQDFSSFWVIPYIVTIIIIAKKKIDVTRDSIHYTSMLLMMISFLLMLF